MAAGRPRTVSDSPDKMIALGIEMLKWVKKNDPVHLSEWYTIEKEFTRKQWQTFLKRPEFVVYYEKALKIVGIKYLKKDNKLNPNISNRWQRVYFYDLREREDLDAEEALERELNQKKKLAEYAKSLGNDIDPRLSKELDRMQEKDDLIARQQAEIALLKAEKNHNVNER